MSKKICIFLAGFLIIAAGINQEVNIYDEGVAVSNAQRILAGELPYRDFWPGTYPVGQYYLLALMFHFFGSSLKIMRLTDIVFRAGLVMIFYSLIRRISSGSLSAIISSLILSFWLASIGFWGVPIFPALFFGFLSIVFLLKFVNARQYYWLILSGILNGLSIIFRHDIGVFIWVTSVFSVAAFDFHLIFIKKKKIKNKLFLQAVSIVLFALFSFLPIGMTTGILVFSGSELYKIWESLIIFPVSVYSKFARLPYPPFFFVPANFKFTADFLLIYLKYLLTRWSTFYLPFFIFIGGLHWSFGKKKFIYEIWTLSIFGIFLFWLSLQRADNIHILPALIPALAVFAIFIDKLIFRRNYKLIILILFWGLLTGMFQSLIISPVIIWLNIVKTAPIWRCNSQLPAAGCVFVSSDQEKAVRYIQTHTISSEPIFVGNLRHDKIFVNDVMFYFLAQRKIAVGYHIFVPGMTTTKPFQEQMISELIKRSVNYVVLSSRFSHISEPNERSKSSGVTLIDDFIRENYQVEAIFWEYTILRRESNQVLVNPN